MASLSGIFGVSGFDAAAVRSPAPGLPPELEFRDELEANGYRPNGALIGDGEIHRIADAQDKRGEKTGWYALHLYATFALANYGTHHEPGYRTWCSRALVSLTPPEKAAFDRVREEDARKRAAKEAEEQARCAELAEKRFATASSASDSHPYLLAKRVRAHGIRLDESGKLVIPARDASGRLTTIETIDARGEKRFFPGGKKRGSYHLIGGPPRDRLYVAEGFATAATVHELTGEATACAFDAGNLAPVAESLRTTYPSIDLIIAADNDRHTDGNPGLEAARKAAAASQGRILSPSFTQSEGTDWNDLSNLEGADVARRQLAAGAPRVFRLLPLAELTREAAPPQWVIHGLEQRNTLGVTFGEPKSAKSFHELDKSLSVTHGRLFHGRKVLPGAVVYVVGEGRESLSRRVLAWLLHHQVEGREAPFYLTPHRVALLDPEEAARLARLCAEVAERHGGIAKIVVDTLARNMGGDENATADMNAFVEACDTHLRVPFGAVVTVVHHTGWAELNRMRGNRALEGAADSVTAVSRDMTGLVTVEPQRVRDGELPPPLYFRLEGVELPMKDEEGNAITSAVLVPEGSPAEAEGALRPQDRRALDWLRAEYLKAGMNLRAQGKDPSSAKIEWRGWKSGTEGAGIWKGGRSTFSNLSHRLEEARLVVRDGPFVLVSGVLNELGNGV